MASDRSFKTPASHFRSLHKSGDPLILNNVWDIPSLNAVLSLNRTETDTIPRPVRAIATASYAIAECQGFRDEELSYEQNLAAIARLAPVVRAAGLPLSVDLQDGYGSRLEEAIKEVIKLGVVGVNIEDVKGDTQKLYSLEENVSRLKRAIATAEQAGCPDFVVNARCDVFLAWPNDDSARLVQETITRGKAYLAAGATTVFVWGGSKRGLRTVEVEELSKAFEGRLAVKLGWADDALTIGELSKIGVARISVGPSLYLLSTVAIREAAKRMFTKGKLRPDDGMKFEDMMAALGSMRG
ncbi:hypothetical protein JX265_007313 [Neoarthrinium moseri]|uniref:Uncharacterized protein n=1 Tax=Neoarthrinium moseri TaxID=1658444 RepID=A0A9Q0AL43_9PEZI|nr:hypothetical protein JX265_007313 [Neoarthrinium moseri]